MGPTQIEKEIPYEKIQNCSTPGAEGRCHARCHAEHQPDPGQPEGRTHIAQGIDEFHPRRSAVTGQQGANLIRIHVPREFRASICKQGRYRGPDYVTALRSAPAGFFPGAIDNVAGNGRRAVARPG